jgi:hypothetical protein
VPDNDTTADAAQPLPPISIRRVLYDVGQSYRHRFGRVVIAALIVFGAAAVIGTIVDRGMTKADDYPVLFIFALAGTTMSQVGTTFYAGLLDKVVGEFELGEGPEPVTHVLRTLPYGSLIVADILITVFAVIGALFLVIPGLVIFTLFAITGPVINIEHLGAFQGMRRSAQFVRHHFWLVFFVVAVPIGVEHQVIYAVHEWVLSHSIVAVFIVEGVVGMIVGSVVGLVEVNIAYALVARDRADTAAAAAKIT